jgi:hypothetical protein
MHLKFAESAKMTLIEEHMSKKDAQKVRDNFTKRIIFYFTLFVSNLLGYILYK